MYPKRQRAGSGRGTTFHFVLSLRKHEYTLRNQHITYAFQNVTLLIYRMGCLVTLACLLITIYIFMRTVKSVADYFAVCSKAVTNKPSTLPLYLVSSQSCL
jgi:hypothetical protein